MGQTRFLVPRRENLPPKAAQFAYLAGLDDIPWRTRVSDSDNILTAERLESESGSFHILWTVAGRGQQMLATATLVERDKPYNLPVELARGTANRLKANLDAWEQAGLPLPPQVADESKRAMVEFVAAVAALERPNDAADHAQRSLEAALSSADLLVAAFGEEAARVRAAQPVKQTILFGADLDSLPSFAFPGTRSRQSKALGPGARLTAKSHGAKPIRCGSTAGRSWKSTSARCPIGSISGRAISTRSSR